ncbi:TetR/AcrR family transcriptional regulator [Alkalicoccobacillus gibsonii]|uniref:TetR/AcrR family transcriptional regulator n=1 Tax=Alkalicoccobacillus gibsonii TaxID=79881 RepID=UPI003F7C4889
MDTHNLPASLLHILAQTEQLIKENGCANTTLKMIMDQSGVSKGAIYHYVNSKDELFGLLLQSHIRKINATFWSILEDNCIQLEEPLSAITEGLTFFLKEEDVTNAIFTYLLSKKDNPQVEEVLNAFYMFSESQAVSWIKAGQMGGVIDSKVDPARSASSFLTYSYGLRVMHIVSPDRTLELKEQFYSYMYDTLAP